MAYTHIDRSAPAPGQPRENDMPKILAAITALVDAANMGMVPDYNYSIEGTTSPYSIARPHHYVWTYRLNTLIVTRSVNTWDFETGLIQSQSFEFSSDGGSTWSPIRTATYTFDEEDEPGMHTGTEWSE